MKKKSILIENIPSIIWGDKSDGVYIFVHGKMSNKCEAESFAEIAVARGYQVLSFDLPEHGGRKDEDYSCTVWNGVADLDVIGKYVRGRWKDISLCACSLGAYFSLLAYKDIIMRRSLFVSPILDMERLIQNMMKLSDVSEKLLEEKREIPTAFGETLNWDYYCYAKEHPVDKWDTPTAILYGSEDNLTGREVIDDFSERFGCELTVAEDGEHWFHTDEQLAVLNNWFEKQMSSFTIITAHKINAKVRIMRESDYECLSEFLYQAVFIPEGEELPPRSIINDPEIFVYIKEFGKQPGDLGVVAEQNGQIIGAAWTRIIPAYGHIDSETPELAISILPGFRGYGIGTKLMQKLFRVLRENGCKQTSLSVQKDNPAVRFYRRLGYEMSGERLDHAGHEDYLMIKYLQSAEKRENNNL